MKHDGILFLGQHNSVRSQIAEGFARVLAPRHTEIYSAGSDPTALHPQVVSVMRELGIHVGGQYAKPISEVPLERISTVITLCRENVWPGRPAGLAHYYCTFDDPSREWRGEVEQFRAFFELRDQLARILAHYFQSRSSSARPAPARSRCSGLSADPLGTTMP